MRENRLKKSVEQNKSWKKIEQENGEDIKLPVEAGKVDKQRRDYGRQIIVIRLPDRRKNLENRFYGALRSQLVETNGTVIIGDVIPVIDVLFKVDVEQSNE
ncbi:hypothetical protein AA14362_1193 [Acetobacter cerevisiae DSM 14362]|nr:hypothetical protein AA14362_1193 [Acetobacter cerevisiae DSM 14362]